MKIKKIVIYFAYIERAKYFSYTKIIAKILLINYQGGVWLTSHRPLGVKLVAVFLLASALGGVVVAHFFSGVLSEFPRLDLYNTLSYTTYSLQLLILEILRYLSFSWLLSVQVIFYPLLSVVLIIVAAGLLLMKSWARIITIIYSVLIIPLVFTSGVTYNGYPIFSPNIFSVLFSFIPDYFLSGIPLAFNYLGGRVFLESPSLAHFLFSYPHILQYSTQGLVAGLQILSYLVPLLSGVLILLYLLSDVKHEFQ